MEIQFKIVTGAIQLIGSSTVVKNQHIHTVFEMATPDGVITLNDVHIANAMYDYLRAGDEASILFSQTNDSPHWYLQAARLEDGRYISHPVDHGPWYCSGAGLLASLFFGFIVGIIPYLILCLWGTNKRMKAVQQGVEDFKAGQNPNRAVENPSPAERAKQVGSSDHAGDSVVSTPGQQKKPWALYVGIAIAVLVVLGGVLGSLSSSPKQAIPQPATTAPAAKAAPAIDPAEAQRKALAAEPTSADGIIRDTTNKLLDPEYNKRVTEAAAGKYGPAVGIWTGSAGCSEGVKVTTTLKVTPDGQALLSIKTATRDYSYGGPWVYDENKQEVRITDGNWIVAPQNAQKDIGFGGSISRTGMGVSFYGCLGHMDRQALAASDDRLDPAARANTDKIVMDGHVKRNPIIGVWNGQVSCNGRAPAQFKLNLAADGGTTVSFRTASNVEGSYEAGWYYKDKDAGSYYIQAQRWIQKPQNADTYPPSMGGVSSGNSLSATLGVVGESCTGQFRREG